MYVYIYVLHIYTYFIYGCLPRWLSSEVSACNVGDPGLIPGSGRFPGGGLGNPLQYSCLEIPIDKGVFHGVAKTWTPLKWLSTHTCLYYYILYIYIYEESLYILKKSCGSAVYEVVNQGYQEYNYVWAWRPESLGTVGISPSLSPKNRQPGALMSKGRKKQTFWLKQRKQIHSFPFLFYSDPKH